MTSLPSEFCPYVGLRPFTQEEQAFFFGRRQEVRVISANLFAAPLTVLYGPSAVGKSSVLQAGVVPRLRQERRTAVAYFNRWQGEGYLGRLKDECRAAIERAHEGAIVVDDTLTFDTWIDQALEQFRGQLLVILDQFERYLLYHAEEAQSAFDADLARAVNRREVGARFLLGIREDGLAKLDRFRKRIPSLLGNTLRLQRLNLDAAREAIEGPLRVYNERLDSGQPKVEILDDLVTLVLEQVRADRVKTGVSIGQGTVKTSDASRDEVETAYLQLVMERLWVERVPDPGRIVMRRASLERLGGAQAIAKHHFDQHLERLAKEDPRVGDMVVEIFPYLVTPTGSKIAQEERDLIALSNAGAERVQWFLRELVAARLLRVTDPPERYEIFHDALARPFLDCRNALALQRAAAVREAELSEQARKRNMRVALVVVCLATLVLAGLFYRANTEATAQRLRAEYQGQLAAVANSRGAAADKLRLQADAERARAENLLEAGRLELQAREAELGGRRQLASDLKQQATAATSRAQQQEQTAARLSTEANDFNKQAEVSQVRVGQIQQELTKVGETSPAVQATLPPPEPPPTELTETNVPAAPTTSEPGPGTTPVTPAPTNTKPEEPAVTGDYRAIYRRAVNAKDRRQWSDAARLMDAAARQRGDTGEVITISGFGHNEPYLPNYYLRLARQSLGDCPGALEAWAKSEQDGAIQRLKEFKNLQQQRASCSARK